MGSGGGSEIGKGTLMRVQELSDWPIELGGEWQAVRKDSPKGRTQTKDPEQGQFLLSRAEVVAVFGLSPPLSCLPKSLNSQEPPADAG